MVHLGKTITPNLRDLEILCCILENQYSQSPSTYRLPPLHPTTGWSTYHKLLTLFDIMKHFSKQPRWRVKWWPRHSAAHVPREARPFGLDSQTSEPAQAQLIMLLHIGEGQRSQLWRHAFCHKVTNGSVPCPQIFFSLAIFHSAQEIWE